MVMRCRQGAELKGYFQLAQPAKLCALGFGQHQPVLTTARKSEPERY
jgi:hypothetical protein